MILTICHTFFIANFNPVHCRTWASFFFGKSHPQWIALEYPVSILIDPPDIAKSVTRPSWNTGVFEASNCIFFYTSASLSWNRFLWWNHNACIFLVSFNSIPKVSQKHGHSLISRTPFWNTSTVRNHSKLQKNTIQIDVFGADAASVIETT